MDTGDLSKLALLILCLALSGFFSASETAFIALPRARLLHLINSGRPGAKRVERLLLHPEKFLATVLLSNNLVNTAAATLATAMAIKFIDNGNLALIVATFGVTLIILLFGETMPKNIAWNRSEAVAFALSRPLTLVGSVLSPAIWLLQGVSSLGNKALGFSSVPQQIGEQEIRDVIAAGAQSGTVEAEEAALLEKVFRFGDSQVREIMTPRPEIVWIEQGTTLEQFLPSYAEHSHTRFPVYDGTIENVVGMLSIKDVLLAVGKGDLGMSDGVTDFLHPAFFVPETKTVSSTFNEMRLSGHGMVLTVDEFGGIAGLATQKQLLQVIVGQVREEGSDYEEPVTPVDEHTFMLDAGAGITEINEELDLHIPEGDYQTVAGFLLDLMGRIPEEGDAVDFQDLRFTVKVMRGVKIEEVELRRAGADQQNPQRDEQSEGQQGAGG